jgi:hypothetical protein
MEKSKVRRRPYGPEEADDTDTCLAQRLKLRI